MPFDASPPSASSRSTVGVKRLIAPIALFVLAGIPLVAYLWETLNRLFAGEFAVTRLGIALVAAALFVLLLRFLARTVMSWETRRPD